MGCTNSIMSRLWTGCLRNLGSIPWRGRRFRFYLVSGLAFVPTLPPSECVMCSSLGVNWQIVKLTAHNCILPKQNALSCTLYFYIGLDVVHRDNFTLYFTDLKIHCIYIMCKIPDTEPSRYIASFSEPWRAMWVTCTNVVSSHLDWWCCLAVQICNWKSGQLKLDNVLWHSVAIQQL